MTASQSTNLGVSLSLLEEQSQLSFDVHQVILHDRIKEQVLV